MLRRGIVYVLILCVTFSSAFVIGYKANQDNVILNAVASNDIAIVNNDQVEEMNDETYLFGDFFIDYVNNYTDDYNFVVTNSNDAKQGLINGKYGAEIIIPSNFTNSLLTYDEQKPETADVKYIVNSDLSDNAYLEVDHFISDTLDEFKGDLSYMYTYAIFDEIHFTQDNLNIIEQNLEPILSFTNEVESTNITNKYELELKDDSELTALDTVDPSEIDATLTEVQGEINNTIDASKANLNNALLALSDDIGVFNENSSALNENLGESSEQLNNIVDNFENFELPELSDFDYTSSFTEIITNELQSSSDYQSLVEQINKLQTDSDALNTAASNFNNNSLFSEFISLHAARSNYYEATTNIEACLASNASDSEARSCINKYIGSYNSAYNNYNKYLQDYVDEAAYHDELSEYLSNFTSSTSAASATEANTNEDGETVGLTTMNTTVERADKTQDAPQLPDIPTISDLSVSNVEITNNATGADLEDNALISFDIVCPDKCTLNIGVNDMVNVKNFNLKLVSGQNVAIRNGRNEITLANVKTGHYTFLLDIERDEKSDSSLSLLIDNASYSVDFKVNTNPIQVVSNYTEDQLTYELTNNGTEDLTSITINNNLFANLELETAYINGTEVDTSLTDENITIDLTEPVAVGDSVTLSFDYRNFTPNNLVVKEQLKINGQTIERYIPFNSIAISDTLSIENSNDVTLDNEQIANISINITSDKDIDINGLTFKLASTPANIAINLEDISLTIGSSSVHFTTEQSGDTVHLIFNNSQTINSDSVVNLKVPFTLTSDAVVDQDVITSSIVSFDSQEELVFNTSLSEELTLKHVNIDVPKVKYVVDSSVCNNSIVNVRNCNFEAGDEITREVIITNNNQLPVSNVEVVDDIGASSYFSAPSDANDYEVTSLNDESVSSTLDNYDVRTENNNLIYSLTVPAHSEVVLSQTITVNDNITKEDSYDNTITIDNTSSDQEVFSTTNTLNVIPVKLSFANLDVVDDNNDGKISPNENVIVSLDIVNNAMRASIPEQVVSLSPSGLIDSITVVSVSDAGASNIKHEYANNQLVIQKKLDAGQSRTIKFNVAFKNFTATSVQSGKVEFNLRKSPSASVDDTLVWNFTTDTLNYRQLALNLLQNGSIHTGDSTNYHSGISSSDDLIKLYNDLVEKYGQINYLSEIVKLASDISSRILNSEAASTLLGQINQSGLITSTNENINIANYDVCNQSNANVCKMIDLYNQIEVNMGINGLEANELNDLLANSKLSVSEQINSITEGLNADTSEVIANLGEIEANEMPSDVDLTAVEEAILNVAESLNESTSTQEEYFRDYETQMLEFYSENQELINDYVTDLTGDDTYAKMASEFLEDETKRQNENSEIIGATQEILPNSSVNGLANTDLYDFLAAPYDYNNELFANKEDVNTEDKRLTSLKLAILCLGLIILLAMIIYVINYRDKE